MKSLIIAGAIGYVIGVIVHAFITWLQTKKGTLVVDCRNELVDKYHFVFDDFERLDEAHYIYAKVVRIGRNKNKDYNRG